MKRVHFLGILGSGMAPLAGLARDLGWQVSGSDKNLQGSKRTSMENRGISLSSDETGLPDDAEIVVYSSAIRKDDPRIALARRKCLILFHRMEFLNLLVGRTDVRFAVAGTHGKTSSSSMLGFVLLDLGYDPDILVGGHPLYLEQGFRAGGGRVSVFETDESDGSFLKTPESFRLCLNIDSDHLEHYGNMDRLEAAFREFIHGGSIVVINEDDQRLAGIAGPHADRVSIENPYCRYAAAFEGVGDHLAVKVEGKPVGVIALKIPGRHFASNALGVFALIHRAMEEGAIAPKPPEEIIRALNAFPGVERRVELIGHAGGAEIFDDYGHHPTEITAVLDALIHRTRERSGRLIAVFQPHRYTRTARLHAEFASSLRAADRVFLFPLYPSGETPMAGVDSALIGRSLPDAEVLNEPDAGRVFAELRPGDAAVFLGAGDISGVVRAHLKMINKG